MTIFTHISNQSIASSPLIPNHTSRKESSHGSNFSRPSTYFMRPYLTMDTIYVTSDDHTNTILHKTDDYINRVQSPRSIQTFDRTITESPREPIALDTLLKPAVFGPQERFPFSNDAIRYPRDAFCRSPGVFSTVHSNRPRFACQMIHCSARLRFKLKTVRRKRCRAKATCVHV